MKNKFIFLVLVLTSCSVVNKELNTFDCIQQSWKIKKPDLLNACFRINDTRIDKKGNKDVDYESNTSPKVYLTTHSYNNKYTMTGNGDFKYEDHLTIFGKLEWQKKHLTKTRSHYIEEFDVYYNKEKDIGFVVIDFVYLRLKTIYWGLPEKLDQIDI